MIENISEKLTEFIFKNNDELSHDECERQTYKYGIEIAIASIVNIITILTAGLIMHSLAEALIFLVCFITLRSYTGGYHANSYLKCNLSFLSTFILLIALENILLPYTINISIIVVFLLLGFCVIYCFAPVENKNKKLTAEKMKKNRRTSILMYTSISVIAIALYNVDRNISIMLILTILSVTMLICAEMFIERRERA